jgi:hypothetical protein
VIGDKLAPVVEQLGERAFAGQSLKNVFFLNFSSRQRATQSAQFITQFGRFLLLHQEPRVSREPFLARDDKVRGMANSLRCH